MNELDIKTMLALNFDGGCVMDAIMWFATGIPNWIPLYILMLYIIYRYYGWKYMLFALLFIGLGVGICDQICNFFKETFMYLRPTHTDLLAQLHTLNGYVGGLTGTVSGHASTSFSIFVTSSLMVRKRWFTIMMAIYAVLTTYSRIYVGVHFPFQILFGIILGISVALLMYSIFKRLAVKYHWAQPPTAKKK